jgi:outer membrane biosynthesis protein TonB
MGPKYSTKALFDFLCTNPSQALPIILAAIATADHEVQSSDLLCDVPARKRPYEQITERSQQHTSKSESPNKKPKAKPAPKPKPAQKPAPAKASSVKNLGSAPGKMASVYADGTPEY